MSKIPRVPSGAPKLVRPQRPEEEEDLEERSLCVGGMHRHEPCKDGIPCPGTGWELESVEMWLFHKIDKSCSNGNGLVSSRIESPGIVRSCHGQR